MNISIKNIEQESLKDSIIHKLDGRVKIVMILIMIVYSVYTTKISSLILLEVYIIILILISNISIKFFLKRLLIVIPIGGLIAILQPFIKPGLILYTLPFNINFTYQGLIFGLLLFTRVFVCLSCVVLLSSVTPLNNIEKSLRKLGLPKTICTVLSMSIRYLFLFFEELSNIQNAQKSRSFDIWNKNTNYIWRIRHIGYTIVLIFLNSYDKGEKVYNSMLSRGYNGEIPSYSKKTKINLLDYGILLLTILIIFLIN
ncbi:MAG: cobalt ECF transporter T component CbiQ [Methanobacteriaceae archaeon]|jgi:cobalt/nickel transport system permease protein|nr:cobalt ECF transporter T component CbiQ [Methanobacteriaceae archaeon]